MSCLGRRQRSGNGATLRWIVKAVRLRTLVNRPSAIPDKHSSVWGYRPDLFAYTRMRAATRYLDCQAMTGVPADRHLTQSTPVLPPDVTAAARRELAASHPDYIVDGLSEYNPHLAISGYPELAAWLAGYREIARIRSIVIYRRHRKLLQDQQSCGTWGGRPRPCGYPSARFLVHAPCLSFGFSLYLRPVG